MPSDPDLPEPDLPDPHTPDVATPAPRSPAAASSPSDPVRRRPRRPTPRGTEVGDGGGRDVMARGRGQADVPGEPVERAGRTRPREPGRRDGSGGARRPPPPPPPAPRRRPPTVFEALSDVPNFFRLLYGLLTDARVDPTDKLLVGAAVGYVLLPEDIIPDWIPLLGEIDDVFLLGVAIDRLLEGAPAEVIRDHWSGDPREVRGLDVQELLGAAAFFLPRRIRRRLRAIGRV